MIQVQGLPAQVLVPTLVTMDNMSINIVSYSCRGFCSSSGYVHELLEHCDILCLQEHWLPDLHLNDLNVSDDFVVIAVSGMASDQVISGRPYGGCAIYCRNQLSVSFSPCPVVSKRFCSREILLADGCLLLLVCVYFPCDNGLAEDIYKVGAVLSKLEGFLESRKYDLLAVVGDFNVDFAHTMFQKLMNYISSWNMLSWRPQICSSPLSSLLMRVTVVRPAPGWTIFCSLLRLLPRSRMLWSCTLVLTSLTICPCQLYSIVSYIQLSTPNVLRECITWPSPMLWQAPCLA